MLGSVSWTVVTLCPVPGLQPGPPSSGGPSPRSRCLLPASTWTTDWLGLPCPAIPTHPTAKAGLHPHTGLAPHRPEEEGQVLSLASEAVPDCPCSRQRWILGQQRAYAHTCTRTPLPGSPVSPLTIKSLS